MAAPVGILTLDKLILIVAEKLGVADFRSGDGTTCLPVSTQFNLDKCVEMVDRGMRMFIDSPPPEGWRWTRRAYNLTFAPAYTGTATAGTATSLTDSSIADDYDDDYFNGYTIKITEGTGEDETATVTDFTGSTGKFDFSAGLSGSSTPDTTSEYRICVSTDVIDADPARYMMPLYFDGQSCGRVTYAANTSHSTPISWVDESMIRGDRASYVNSGYPQRVAIRPYQPTGTSLDTSRRWEAIFDPEPSVADTIIIPYLAAFDGVQLVGGTADSASSTTIVDATLTTLYPSNDVFNGWVVEVIDGTGRGSYATVTDYTGASGTLTVADWLSPSGAAGGTDPEADSVFIIKPIHPYLHPAGYAYDQVIEVACLAACELYGNNKIDDGHFTNMFYERKISEAYGINRRQVPRGAGRMSGGSRRRVERMWNTVTTDNDI